MKNRTLKKIEYLEESLIEWLSNTEENNQTVSDNICNKTRFKDIIENVFLFLFLLFVFLVQFPFLLISNLIIAFRAIKNGIPFKVISILLPEKRIDLIDNKIKIEIRHREHSPPHYHIIIDDSEYAINIATGEFLNGEIKNKQHLKTVKDWHNKNKNLLIKTWNETRPSDCPVGKIK